MKKKRFAKLRSSSVFFAVVAALLLVAIFSTMIVTIYNREEEEAYELLHLQTKQFKDEIRNKIDADVAMIESASNLARKFYENGEDMSRIFGSFRFSGLVNGFGILYPDNTFKTRKGTLIDYNGKIEFKEEAERGAYISGREGDLLYPDFHLVRIAQPIISKGKTVGILYGSIDLSELSKTYTEAVSELGAQLYVYESGNGDIIIDTYDNKLGNISDLATRKYADGYSYEKLVSEEKGFSVFESKTWNEMMYIHYSPLEISDWKIMLARRKSQVFSKATYIVSVLYISLLCFAVIIGAYFVLLMILEKRKKRVTSFSSQIRKFLLEVNHQQESVEEALERVAAFGGAHGAVFADTDAEEYVFTLPEYSKKMPSADEHKYFLNEIFAYAVEVSRRRKKSLNVVEIVADSDIEKSNPKFTEFMKAHKITRVVFASITNTSNQISVLCAINPAKIIETKSLLADIAVCFSIAIFNKKHLKRTELAASTDSLTGLLNRVTYKLDIKEFDERKPENFACVYVDVNELHMMNNKYGHAAGDEMLIYIANTLKEVFFGNRVYRMGGDEFLVFIENTDRETVDTWARLVSERIAPKGYNVAIGTSFRTRNTNTEELVNEAEVRMYEEKAGYYQSKENEKRTDDASDEYNVVRTGMDEVDTFLSATKKHYSGIYRVNLLTDEAKRIIAPAHFGYNETEPVYSELFKKYVEEFVHQDFHRAMFSFLNYESIKNQLENGNTPGISYKKKDGEMIFLTVHLVDGDTKEPENTLWIFEKN